METKSKKIISFSIFSTLIASVLHAYLTYKYYGLKYGFSTSNLCNINDKFNCDVTSTSSYAELFGVPIALLGVLTNLVIFILSLNLFINSQDSKRPFRYGYYLSIFTFLASLIMGSISTFVLKVFCPFCIGTYFLSLTNLVAYFLVIKNDASGLFFQDISYLFNKNKASLGLFLSIPLLGFYIHWNIEKRFVGERLDLFIAESLSLWEKRPVVDFDKNKGLIAGNETTKFEIVEFADYLCPHCKTALTPLKTFIASHSDARLVFKPYPLDGICNPGIDSQNKGNGVRCRLAAASYCAQKEFSAGWEYHEYIFENQEKLHYVNTAEEADKILCELKPENCEKLKSCMQLEDTENWVKSAAQEGVKGGISGTPSIFVNGKKLEGGANLMILKALYSQIK